MNLSTEYLKILLDRMEDAVIAIDKEGYLTMVNNRAEELLGLKKREYMNMRIDKIIQGSELLRVVQTGSEELNVRFHYGSRDFMVDRTPVKREGRIEGAIAIFHDITQAREMSKKLEKNIMYTEILDTIIDTCSERLVVIDQKGIIKLMSDSYKQFLGVEDPEGKHVKDVIENTRLDIVLETGESEIGELQVINGHKMVAMRMPIRKQGKIVGAVGKVMFKDISELTHLSRKSLVLEKELDVDRSLKKERTAKYSFKSITGESEAIIRVINLAKKVALTDSNVLITGESGTGKEVFVHAIHNASLRRTNPFIKINCAAIPSELLESELFGYEEGAFTGAKRGGKIGKFQLAEGGTLLLDEIGDMPLKMQAKLLRVLQEKEVVKIGGSNPHKVDVRIMASTNQDLGAMVEANAFRGDLYYRLNVMNLELPALRNRLEDIPSLTQELCLIIGNRLGICVHGIADEVLEIFKHYRWPGNIRELENVIERAINLLDEDQVIRAEHLPDHMGGSIHRLPKMEGSSTKLKGLRELNLKRRIELLERQVIKECLDSVDNNKNRAAKILNISRVSLYTKIEKYGLL